MRAKLKVVPILQAYYGVICPAKLAGTLDNGLEHGPDIGR